ncbi:acetylglutamate kinase [Amycolatopsis anabasis]|uniref:amino acid kinase family protein n=1 Tax=Amycolatopsis anabasis TaxID=1840409 RepID=UPI00131DB3A9|nr:acetylglutamate kinase [Amycolatopsis anabasis]
MRGESPPIVVKIGGSVLGRLGAGWWDVAASVLRGRRAVLVHGWSGPLTAYQRQRHRTPVFVTSQHGFRSRLTDEVVLSDITAVSERLRAGIAAELAGRGVPVRELATAPAVLGAEVRSQLWWTDGELRPLRNLVGPITSVDADAIGRALEPAGVAVLTPLARSAEHPAVNVDADRAAAAVAARLGAHDLVFVTDVPGVLRDGARVDRLTRHQLDTVRRYTSGGMRKKIKAVAEALDGGVHRAVIGGADLAELLAGRAGTELVPG